MSDADLDKILDKITEGVKLPIKRLIERTQKRRWRTGDFKGWEGSERKSQEFNRRDPASKVIAQG